MLEVSTTLAKSNIQGIGLFTNEKISKGKVVWRYNNITTISWSQEEWEAIQNNIPLNAFNNIERFSYFIHNKWHLNLDDSRFMNHSSVSNLGYDRENNTCYALKDIEAGEELTIDYSEFCDKTNTNTCHECGLCDA